MNTPSNSEKLGKLILLGAPNSGKTTLFNWLTGLKHKTVNYPGSTVQYVSGSSLSIATQRVEVIDTPGVYSLSAHGAEEEVTINFLKQMVSAGGFHVLLVLDSTRLKTNMNMFSQLREAGIPFSIALTMVDCLASDGYKILIDKLERDLGIAVFLVNGKLGAGVKEIISAAFLKAMNQGPLALDFSELSQNKQILVDKSRDIFSQSIVVDRLSRKIKQSLREQTEKTDRWLLHPFWGILFFVAIMFLAFSSIFWIATPFMDAIDALFGELSKIVVNNWGDNLFTNFLSKGLISGVGAVLVFVPQIAILFTGLTILEDSGYLARAATLIDRPLQLVGLSGRSFVPLLSGYACAIPAMMAARAVGGVKARFLTLFVIPLMSCSARLPVYALLLALLFRSEPWKAGLLLTVIYILSGLIAILTSALVSRWIKETAPSVFMLDLPLYRWPSYRTVLSSVWTRTKAFILRAGPMIVSFSLIIWTITTFPNYQLPESERLESSIAGQFGHLVEPILEPMGSDWRMGVGLLSAFAAREVFVSSLAIVFHVTEPEGEAMSEGLLSSLASAVKSNGEPLFTLGSTLALIVYFMIALQCMSTVAIARVEFGSWRAPVVQLITFNLLAYCLAVFVYQVWKCSLN